MQEEGHFCWCNIKPGESWHIQCDIEIESGVWDDLIPAFTVAELGEMLPNECYSWHTQYGWVAAKRWRAWKDIQPDEICSTEADARAKLLIYLIKQGIVDPKTF